MSDCVGVSVCVHHSYRYTDSVSHVMCQSTHHTQEEALFISRDLGRWHNHGDISVIVPVGHAL